MEALAAVRAFTLAKDIGISSIILEGDSTEIITALGSDNDPFASFAHIIANARSLLEFFRNIVFSFVRRQEKVYSS